MGKSQAFIHSKPHCMTKQKTSRRQATKFSVAFGAQVRTLRNGKGWSQEELAHRARIHVTYLSSVERGRRNPTLNLIVLLARALGVTPSRLLGGIHRERAQT